MKSKVTLLAILLIGLLVISMRFVRADNIFSGTGPDYLQSTMGSTITLSLIPTNGTALFCYTNGQGPSFTFMGTTKVYTNIIPFIGVLPATNYIMTNLPVATFVSIDITYTNLASGFISNITTGASFSWGGTGGGGATNSDESFIRLGPNEKWMIFTNTPNGASINYDELRN